MTGLAQRLAEELVAVAGRRRRLLAAECEAALVELAPALEWDPSRRARLRELLAELEEAGVVEWSAKRDREVRPELPAFVTLAVSRPEVDSAPAVHAWRPEIAWAHDLRLTAAEVEALQAVQEFLRDSGDAPVVPHRERSLQLFGHEKRLDRLTRGRLFEPGRLTLDLLRCWWAPPPIAWRPLGGDGPLVVSENAAGFHSLSAGLKGQVRAVAYGGGAAFTQSVASLADIPGLDAVVYVGDLDAEGLAIPQRAAIAAEAAGVPVPRPAVALWQALVELAPAVGENVKPVPAEVASEITGWLEDELLAKEAQRLLEAGVRVAQEAIPHDVVAGLR